MPIETSTMSGLNGERMLVVFGFLMEAGDFATARDLDDAELRGPRAAWTGSVAMVMSAPVSLVVLHHEGIVHLVNVIAGEDEDISWALPTPME